MRIAKIAGVGMAVGLFLTAGVALGWAEETVGQVSKPVVADVLKVIQENVKSQSIKSGTLDIYDEKINKVRNLRTMKFPETASENEGVFIAAIEYRDINSGDIVTVEATVDGKVTPLVVKDFKMVKIEKLKDRKEGEVKKEFPDEEIQAFMKSSIDQQVKFTGNLQLFDEERNKMRSLELVKLDTVVKRMGIFYTSRAEFKDVENGDLLGVDVSVEYKDGELTLQALRIREFRRAPKP